MRDSFVINTFSYLWQGPLDRTLNHLADRGFRDIEIQLSAPNAWPSELDQAARRQIRDTLKARDIRIVSLNVGGFDNNLSSPARSVRDFAVETVDAAVKLASELGAHDIIISPGLGRPLLPPSATDLGAWLSDSLDRLLPGARAAGVHLLLENIPYSYLPRIEQLVATVEMINDAYLGIIYDAANAVFINEDPVLGLTKALAHMRLLHLSDTGLDVWKHDPVGTGVVPFEAVLNKARELGYSGPIVAEIISSDPETAIPASIAALAAM